MGACQPGVDTCESSKDKIYTKEEVQEIESSDLSDFEKGKKYEKLGDYRSAIKSYDRVIKNNKNDETAADAYIGKGNI